MVYTNKYVTNVLLSAKKTKTSSKGGGAGGAGKVDTSVGDGIYDLNVLKTEMDNNVEKLKDELHRKYASTLTIGLTFIIHICTVFTMN